MICSFFPRWPIWTPSLRKLYIYLHVGSPTNQKTTSYRIHQSSNVTEVGVWFLYSSKTGWFQSISAQGGGHLLGSTGSSHGGPGWFGCFKVVVVVVETRCKKHGRFRFEVVEISSTIQGFAGQESLVCDLFPMEKRCMEKFFWRKAKTWKNLVVQRYDPFGEGGWKKLNNHVPMKKISHTTGLDRNGPWNSRFLHLIGRYHGSGSGGSGLREGQLLRICKQERMRRICLEKVGRFSACAVLIDVWMREPYSGFRIPGIFQLFFSRVQEWKVRKQPSSWQ